MRIKLPYESGNKRSERERDRDKDCVWVIRSLYKCRRASLDHTTPFAVCLGVCLYQTLCFIIVRTFKSVLPFGCFYGSDFNDRSTGRLRSPLTCSCFLDWQEYDSLLYRAYYLRFPFGFSTGGPHASFPYAVFCKIHCSL